MVRLIPSAPSESRQTEPAFNLWHEPWIDVIGSTGHVERRSLHDCLQRAHDFRSLADPSPLIAASVHRLLAAILQWMYQPRDVPDIAAVLSDGQIDPERIHAFGARYAHRFDLFSPDAPLFQTGDIAPVSRKGSPLKTVSYLLPEYPAGTNVIHFHHAYDVEHHFCPACAAGGLVTIPAFSTSGGAGIKPSINGVPPLYVLPSGSNLAESLGLSLIAPQFQPEVRADRDLPIWEAPPVIGKSEEVTEVGYVQSLTFPARRVRLVPEMSPGRCTRCGSPAAIRVSYMVFEMGQSRPKDAPSWLDPFAAYTVRGEKPPAPVRPQAGKDVWREYATLFLTRDSPESTGPQTIRPRVVQQIDALESCGAIGPQHRLTFRCTGLRTDMKAKVFEWTDGTLDVPAGLLSDPRGSRAVRRGIDHASEWGRDLEGILHRAVAPSRTRDRYQPARERLRAGYWRALAGPFSGFVLTSGERAAVEQAERDWNETLLRTGLELFRRAVEDIGDRGADLRVRVQAIETCRLRMGTRRKEWNA